MLVKMKYVTIYTSSSNHVIKKYRGVCKELSDRLTQEGYGLVYGGANVGLMKVVADEFKKNQAPIISVILELFDRHNLTYEQSDEVIVTKTMSERKKIMQERGDAIIALPGGFGTLEELSEAITQKYLKRHNNPIIIFNVKGFFDHLLAYFERLIEEKLAKPSIREYFYVADSVDSIIKYLSEYQPIEEKSEYLSTN